MPLIRRRLRRLAKEHSVERIYAHFPNSSFLIAAWQVAEELRLPLTVYFDILWEETYGREEKLAKKFEKRIITVRRQPVRDHRVCGGIPHEEARSAGSMPAACDRSAERG